MEESEAAIDVKTELVRGPVAVRALRGYAAGLAAVALVTLFAFRLHLNLSASGSLYFLIVVMVSVLWGFWEATFASLIAGNCLNYFFVPPVLSFRVGAAEDWVALAPPETNPQTV